MENLAGKLRQVNGRLRAARVGVSVEQAGGRLRLRATLPPPPGSVRSTPFQQRIALGLPANPAGLRQAETEARLLGAQLAAREFDWGRWGKTSGPPVWRCGEAVAALEGAYLSGGGSADTWAGDYYKILRRLPADQALTVEALRGLVEGTAPNSRSRVRACVAAAALARHCGLDFDAAPLRGAYSPRAVAPRDLPTDAQIAAAREGLDNPAWRWVYGMMACYGLRNHEVFYLDLSAFPRVQVEESTKTGSREVWPCYPEWADLWGLDRRVLPPVQLDRPNQRIGNSVTRYLSPLLPFRPYDLRHAWAVRTLIFGWPIELSARQMGHSVEVHSRTYQRWISSQQIEGVYQLLVSRADRPRPPGLE